MTDARVREAERRWRETGAVADEARLLLERVRAQALDPHRLRLAAALGHAAALEALGEAAPPLPTDLGTLMRALVDWGPEVVARAVVVLAEQELVRRGSAGPRSKVRRELLDLCRPLVGLADVGDLATSSRGREGRRFVAQAIFAAGSGAMETVELFRLGSQAARQLVAPGAELAVRAAVEADLAPWALGTGDPLRARVLGPRPRRSPARARRERPAW